MAPRTAVHRAASDLGAPQFQLSFEGLPVTPKYSYWVGFGLAAVSSAAFAQMPASEDPRWRGYSYAEPPGLRDPREGKVEVQTFIANSPRIAELGHGSIAISTAAFVSRRSPVEDGQDQNAADGLFEAALANRLAGAGYQTGAAGPAQTIEFSVSRELIQPPEPRRSPVAGGVAVGAGTRGSGMGLGIMIDLSKPLGALVATRIEARISDAATHELLWQGRAEVMARENDRHWRPEMIAERLTASLFKSFPRPIGGR